MSRDSNSAASNLVCFLLGAAVGAAVALLYAPQEGEATRRLLSEKAHDVRDKATEVTHTVKEKLDVVADKAQGVLRRGQQAVVETADKVGDNANAAADALTES